VEALHQALRGAAHGQEDGLDSLAAQALAEL
jgi:hypothetical protein